MCSVFEHLQETDVVVKLAKCEFMKRRIKYLGYIIAEACALALRMSKQSPWLQVCKTRRHSKATWDINFCSNFIP